ncbi:hypothetical protein [Nostoc sp.]|uniref:hypothetical protein n=1 Tax=Nostoc sp. TaxID=1180 RepID=UPI002FF80A18
MASTFDIKGTSLDSFKIGLNGPSINRNGQLLSINSTNSGRIITAADLHPGFRSGLYYPMNPYSEGLTNLTTGCIANTINYQPFYIAHNITIDNLAVQQGTTLASQFMRWGLYTNNFTTGLPDTLIVDVGDQSTAGTGTRSPGLSSGTLALNAGWYWFAIASSGAPGLYCENNVFAGSYLIGSSSIALTTPSFTLRNTFTYAALPSTAPTSALSTINIGVMMWLHTDCLIFKNRIINIYTIYGYTRIYFSPWHRQIK